MIVLRNPTCALRLITGVAATTSAHVAWVDRGVTSAYDGANALVSEATTTIVAPGPAANTTRRIIALYVHNQHAELLQPCRLEHFDGVAYAVLIQVTLEPGDSLHYEAPGFEVRDAQGRAKLSIAGGTTAGVESFNGRTGAVVPALADYNGFFLTPAEGDAAYAPIGAGGVTTFAGRSGAVIPLVADYDGFFDAIGAAAAAQAASQPLDTDLTAIAGLSTTGFGRGLLALADAAAGRSAFALGSAAVEAAGAFDGAGAAASVASDLASHVGLTQSHGISAFGATLVDDADAAAGRATLGAAATSHGHTAGDVTGLAAVATSGSASDLGAGTLPIARVADGAVTLAKLANVATATFVGRTTAGTGVPEAMTVAQATALLALFTDVANGLVPASAGGTANFLRADGAWAAPSGGAGGNDPRLIVDALTADQADITGVTLVEIAGLTQAVGVGTWQFRYAMIYQTTATTTGVEFVVDHTGSDTAFVSNAYFGSTGGAAATGIADQQGVGTAAGLMEVKTARAANARPGVTIGVDTANADCLMCIEGVIRVSVAGNLRILMAAELAALVVRAKAGSCVTIIQCGAT